MDNQSPSTGGIKLALAVVVLLAVAALILAVLLGPEYIQFQDLTLEQVLKLLVGLSIVALFVERATYVLVRLKYGTEDTKLEKEIRAVRKGGTPAVGREQPVLTKERAVLSGRKLVLSMSASLVIGIIVAWIGVRCLRPLMDPTAFSELVSPWQRNLFGFADIVITGALIGGGADGIYQISMTVTDLFKFLREKTQ
jgi:prolipoprotein diacylglyceryltransferase